MRSVLIAALMLASANIALAQDSGDGEMIDQEIRSAPFSFTGSGEGPAPVIEVNDQEFVAAAFEFRGAGEGPPPTVEFMDQDFDAEPFAFTGSDDSP